MAKRKRSIATESHNSSPSVHDPLSPPSTRRKSDRIIHPIQPAAMDPNPQTNRSVLDSLQALRASPDAESAAVAPDMKARSKSRRKAAAASAPIEAASNVLAPNNELGKASKAQNGAVDNQVKSVIEDTEVLQDEGDLDLGGLEDADQHELKEALSRPPPVNSSYLPLPWKGRLGYACLCTYLRYANPPVFSSRTCRIASILENRHPLKDPSQRPHPTKNRPDKDQSADIARGQAFVEGLGLANARDIVKMLRWNDKYGIKFMRLSSEMFPFASHEVYGYKLAPFASETLAEAGKIAAELGHRLTTHPGQFTQLGSPRKEVIESSIRDLEYHSELLSLLKLPPQQNRDAVMILHMGGVFGDKAATLDRFRNNYKRLNQDIKKRLVLENDDVSWSVHDLLPICEELNIPMVLDFHHHNIIFDAEKIREGTLDIVNLYGRIKATWTRKQITQKMHYSEPTPAAITCRQRRKHSPRVATLPPCNPSMDLMIEAKDKEQAVFELMRTFKLPGFDSFNDMTPHVRYDENKPFKPPAKKAKKRIEEDGEDTAAPPEPIAEEEVGMGGPDRRVYWPPGMEEWLRPAKRAKKNKDETMDASKRKKTITNGEAGVVEEEVANKSAPPNLKSTPRTSSGKRRTTKYVPTPSTSEDEASEPTFEDSYMAHTAAAELPKPARLRSRGKKVNYAEDKPM